MVIPSLVESDSKDLFPEQRQRGFGHLRPGHAVLLVEMFGHVSALAEFVANPNRLHHMRDSRGG